MQEAQLTQLLVVIAVVIAVLAIIWLLLRRRRTTHLRDRFGDEYDRTVDNASGRGDAERNLEAREKRVAGFDIRPLTAAERDRFTHEWKEVKTLFVDSPPEAVLRGDRLLATMMDARGYPMGDFDRRFEDLTVDHGTVARHYRDGHAIAAKRDEATTEEMRRALNHYEKLFDELVRDDDGDSGGGTTVDTSGTFAGDRDGNGIADTGTVSMTANDQPVRPQ